MPRISILLPVYNGAKFIAQAIESVLAQDFSDWELVIINDGSVDETASIVKQFTVRDPRIIFINNDRNLGIQKALNGGLNRARGQYIARIDYDDVWVDVQKLSKQTAFFDLHPSYVLVGTGVIVVNEKGDELSRFLNVEADEEIRNGILGKNQFIHSSIVFQKNAAQLVGGYSEEHDALHVEDYDLWLRLGGIGKMANLPIYAVQWMMRKNALSSRNRMTQFYNSMRLVVRFRRQYPGFVKGFVRSWVRLIAYGIFSFIPILKFKYFIFKTGRQQ